MTRGVGREVCVTFGRCCAAGLLALGCADLLGIHDPFPRPPDADGGEAGAHEGNPPRAGSNAGGAAGEPDAGGGVDDAGHGPTGGGGAAGGDAGAHGGDAPGGGAGAGMGGSSGASAGGGGMGGGGGTGGGGTSGGGTGGSGPPAVCALGDPPRCDPASPKTPQVCSSAGQWVRNAAQNNGLDCPIQCNAGVCGECSNGDVSCKDNYPRTCVNGAWVKQPTSCPDVCVKGACVSAASCAGVAPATCNQESCCLSLEVTGDTFNRDGNALYPATISSFTMDKYEVTVDRLKRYIDWYFGPEGSVPALGAGKSLHFAPDPGWKATYPLPARTVQGMQDMQDMLSCVLTHGDPADANATYLGTSPTLPANCVTFYVAYAMCIWDGGRLPTEAEWDFAATSPEQRFYPWSVPASSTVIDATYAVYTAAGPKNVGSLLSGRGRYGQMDLAGNVAEWTLDYSAPYFTPCVDCINTTVSANRSPRGGGYTASAVTVKTAFRTSNPPDAQSAKIGFRCVHDL